MDLLGINSQRRGQQQKEEVPFGGLFGHTATLESRHLSEHLRQANRRALITNASRNICKALSVGVLYIGGFARLLEIVSLPFDLFQALDISLQI